MKQLQKLMQTQFDKMCGTGKLFRSKLTGRDVWYLYLNGFGDDPKFRDPESSVHNCNNCNNFIRRYGNIVAINVLGQLTSIFDLDPKEVPEEYRLTIGRMNYNLISHPIENVFFETFEELKSLPYESCTKQQEKFRLGTDRNVKRYTKEEAEKFGVVTAGQEIRFEHMYLDLPRAFVDQSGKSVETIMSVYKSKYDVFKRGMEEISLDTLTLVKDLITQGSLLDGTTHMHSIDFMIETKKEYNNLSTVTTRDAWFWTKSYSLTEQQAKFRNTLIGVLCSELTEGMEINLACLNWNKRVDPANYHKATAPITKKQIEEAQKFVEENGYLESFDRRIATIDDINVSEILHSNIGDAKVKAVTVFDKVKAAPSTQHKRAEFDKLEEVTIEKFMKDILPNCTQVEAYLENKMEANLVTLTTAEEKESKPIFKWDNNYSYTFKGNLAGKSMIKEAVKSQGGKVDGVLRFSIMWAEDNIDNSDLDAHCHEPNGNTIYYSNKVSRTGGNLDLDIINPQSHKDYTKNPVVENITYPAIKNMPNGEYKFYINPFSRRESQGWKAEIEFDGQIYSYQSNSPLAAIKLIATVNLKDGVFTIKHNVDATVGGSVARKVWGVETNQFHKVDLVCTSPNHWGKNKVGNLYYMFMLNKCKADTPIRGFHNENLNEDLMKHKKVMEVLGNSAMIIPSKKQLCGIGFNSTVHEDLIVKCSGSFKRTLKICF